MRRIRTAWAVPAILLLMAALHPPAARSAQMSVTVRQVGRGGRTHAPVPAELIFGYSGDEIIEGDLELVFTDSGREVLAHYTIRDLAIATDPPPRRIMLPAQVVSRWGDRTTISVRFLTKGGVVALPDQLFALPGGAGRSFLVCACHGGIGPDSPAARLAQSLDLENFAPKPEGGGDTKPPAATTASRVRAEDLPAAPLGYCCYDIVLLAGDEFASVHKKQLDALRRWVQAGGSLCVVPDKGLEPYHVEFLNALTGRREPAFELHPNGGVGVVQGVPAEGPGIFYSELGRTVVALHVPETRDNPRWRRAVAFLWKASRKQMDSFAADGRWRTDLETASAYEYTGYRYGYAGTSSAGYYSNDGVSRLKAGQPDAFTVLPIPSLSSLAECLKPEAIRVVPFAMLALILLAFIVAVGPADYMLLGLLRCRRLTWLLLPAVSIGFTVFVVLLSRGYMGGGEHLTQLTIRDVGSSGRLLRESRVELIFSGREKTLKTRAARCLFAQMEEFGSSVERQPVRLDGAFPADYTVTQRVPQWTPILSRYFTFDPEPDDFTINWDAVGPADLEDYSSRTGIAGKLQVEGCPDVAVFLAHLDRMDRIHGELRTRDSEYGDPSYMSPISPYAERYTLDSFLEHTCTRPRVGLFSVVSQMSPNGAGSFEDLSLLDSTDEDQWVLTVVRSVGEDYVVYRRLYRRESGP